jgi:hypothetical protein
MASAIRASFAAARMAAHTTGTVAGGLMPPPAPVTGKSDQRKRA